MVLRDRFARAIKSTLKQRCEDAVDGQRVGEAEAGRGPGGGVRARGRRFVVGTTGATVIRN
jgi:hypothetical protein